jgi:hypothetical protein
MSHKNKITAIVQPTENVIDWVVNRLKTYSEWSVQKYSGTNYSKIFNYLPELSLPAVVVSYRGSSSNDDFPRRTLDFSIIVATEDVGEFETAATKSVALVDKVMELLDYESYNGILFKFKRDTPQELPNTSIAAYVLSFTGEDY